MIRLLLGLFVFLPMLLSAIVCRLVASSRIMQVIALLLIISACCSGCGVTSYTLERDARQCQAEAWTVEAMLECNRLYPQYDGTVTDKLSQPLGEIERHIQHKGHDHG